MPNSNTRIRATRGATPPQGGKKLAGVDTKWWLLGGGLAAFFVYRSYKKASAASSATPTNDGTIDPATGMPYADEYANLSNYGGGGGFLGYSGGYPIGIDPSTGVSYAQEAFQSITPSPTGSSPIPTQTIPTPAPTPAPAPAPVSAPIPTNTPVVTSGNGTSTTWKPPVYPTGYSSSNPFIAADGVSLSSGAVQTIIGLLHGLGIDASTTPHEGVAGWEGWAPNLWVYNLRSSVTATDKLAPYRSVLSTIVSPYSSAQNAQTALAQL